MRTEKEDHARVPAFYVQEEEDSSFGNRFAKRVLAVVLFLLKLLS